MLYWWEDFCQCLVYGLLLYGFVVVVELEELCVCIVVMLFLVDLDIFYWFVGVVVVGIGDIGDGYCYFCVGIDQCVRDYFQYGFLVDCVELFQCLCVYVEQVLFGFVVVDDYVVVEEC